MPVDTYDLWLDPAFKMSTRMNLAKNDDPDSAMELKQRSATALTESLLDRMPSMSGLGCLSLAPPKTFFDCPLNGRENHTHIVPFPTRHSGFRGGMGIFRRCSKTASDCV